MRTKAFSLLAAGALVLSLFGQATAADSPLTVTVNTLVEKLSARFSPAVGTVVEAEAGSPLVVKFDEGSIPVVDQELLLFKVGEEVVNKLTGEKLGRFDQAIGLVRVLEVSRGLGRVQVLQLRPGASADSGNIVKYSRRIDAVVEQAQFFGTTPKEAERVSEILSLALERSGRFRPTVMSAGGEVADIWKEGRYSFLVKPIVSSDKEGPRLDLRVTSQYTSKVLFVVGDNFKPGGPAVAQSGQGPAASTPDLERLMELEQRLKALEEAKKAEVSPEVNPDINQLSPVGKIPVEIMQQYRATQDLAGETHLLNIAMGDVDGDGRAELVGMGNDFIKIYRWDGSQFAESQTIKGSSRSHFLHLDVADINGVGPEEIFVTHMIVSQGLMTLENKLASFVLENRGGSFAKIWSKQPYFLRVLKSPQLGRGVLLAQEMGSHDMYRGDVMQFRWNGSTYVREPNSVIPPQFHIYGFMIADLKDSGTPEFFVIQDSGHLASFNQGIEPTWTSAERVGGFNHVSFKQLPRDPSLEKYIRKDAPPDEMLVSRYLKGRMEVVRLGGPDDGHYGLLIGSNFEPLLSRALISTTILNNGRVAHYAWNGIQYVKEWETKPEQQHYLADFAIGDIEGDGTKELVLLLHTTKYVLNPTSRLELYRLGKQ